MVILHVRCDRWVSVQLWLSKLREQLVLVLYDTQHAFFFDLLITIYCARG